MIKKLNGNQIKMIAIIAMFMDHFATTFYPNYEKYWWLLLIHLIGRVAHLSCGLWWLKAIHIRIV